LNVAGGFISPQFHPVSFLKEIIVFVELNKFVISFFNLEDHDALLLDCLGFQRSRFGVESRIPLSQHEWQGKQYSWVRRQSNFVSRQDVTFEEWDTPSICQKIHNDRLAELQFVSEEHLSSKTQKKELPFFEGRLIPGHLHRRRIFVAKSNIDGGRIEGFVMCTPMLNGTQWAIEMYRQREDSIRGTIPYLFREVIDPLKQEECDEVSICAVPTIGVERKLPASSRKVKIALLLWQYSGSLIYDTRGLYHFKTRFRPNISDTFVCAYPKSTWNALWAYIQMMNTFDLKWSKVFQKALTASPNRKTLIKPNKAA